MAVLAPPMSGGMPPRKKPIYAHLYFQVLVAIALVAGGWWLLVEGGELLNG